ncbi:MAG: phosphatidylserine decarboxylase family protein [Bacteroidales bacterium]|jgi:phosphatidylserine decarboxylase|nr:phosphatidylserine decarboxylase family protein [Bacteroidales bacterium]
MSIHKEGYRILAFSLLILLLLNIFVSTLWVDETLLKWTFLICSFILYVFLIFFFRRPERALEPDPELVFAPADGKVVVIEETEEMEYFKDTRLQVSIFMSPLNVHSNRYPVSGRIKFVRYHPGNKMVAWHPKSSELNERSTIVIETKTGKEVLVRQVAGAVARRIVTYAKENQDVRQGDELGFIKFGSRVDIFLPMGTEVEVSILQQVRANKSIIAKI